MPRKTAATVSGSVNNEKKACHKFKDESQLSAREVASGEESPPVPDMPVGPGPMWAIVSQQSMVHLIQAASKGSDPVILENS